MPRPRNEERARAMYQRYEDGLSLAEVGEEFGVRRQSVYDAFKRRGWQMREKSFQEPVMYRGDAFTPDPDGYYRRTTGDRKWLHQLVWEDAHGPIPPSMHIHHRDEDKANNSIENLECLTPEAHGLVHKPFQPAPEKSCLYCGEPLVKKVQPNGTLERPAEVARRTYCDVACSNADRRGRSKGWSPRRDTAEAS